MDKLSSILGEERWQSPDGSNIYRDNDGSFDYTLNNNDDDPSVSYRMQILVTDMTPEYFLCLIKSNGQPAIEISHSDVSVVKSKFYTLFHRFTGNFWHHRGRFVKTPGHFDWVLSDDLDHSSSSEEHQVTINEINQIPNFFSLERAFFDVEANALNRTHQFFYDGLNWQISLPGIFKDDPIVSSLLTIRPFIIRIGILFEKGGATKFLFATGILLNQHLALTCAHNFDPVVWASERIPLTKTYVCATDPADPALFSLANPNASVIEANLVQRGLHKDRMSNLKELEDDNTDLAIIRLVKPAPHLNVDDHFDPKFGSSPLSKSIPIPVNSKLFLIGINGELHDDRDLIPYRHINGFANVTIDKLNNHHQVNHKSVSLGRLLGEFPSQKQYAMHSCSSLAGSSGSVILDLSGRLLGIHCGVSNSRQDKNKEFFFNKDTFNKFLSVDTTEFHEFIREVILPNIDNKQQAEKWQSLTN